MRDAYFYACIIGFTLGLAVATLVPMRAAWVGLPATVALGWWVLGRERAAQLRRPFATPLFVGVLFCSFLALGLGRMIIAQHDPAPARYAGQVNQTITLTGRVTAEPDPRATSVFVTLRTNGVGFLAHVDPHTPVRFGDRVTVTGKLEVPTAFASDLGRTFHYPQYLKARGISYILNYAHITSDTPPTTFSYRRQLLTLKHAFHASFDRAIPEPAAGLGAGLLLGVRSALGTTLENDFRTTGVVHIIVLSGYNISLVVTFFMYVFSFLLPYRWRLVFGLVAVTSFALIVGLSATVVRASIMAGTLLFLQWHGNTYHVMRALFLAAFIMLLLNPYLLLFDPGFQLSFVATLALILVAPHVERYLTWIPTWRNLREFVTATIATQLFVTPLLLYLIGQFSVVAIIVNVLVLPVVPAAMLLTFLTGLAGFVSPVLANVVGAFAYVALTYILRVVTNFAVLPFAAFMVPAFPAWVLGLMYAVLGLLIWRRIHPPRHGRTAVRDWTIVETNSLRDRKAAGSRSDPAALPVFFR